MDELKERRAMEYPDAAGYPDGHGFLDEGTARLVDEVRSGEVRDLDLPSTDADDEVAVLHRAAEQRFVAMLGDREIAAMFYHDKGGRYVIYHTYVEPAFRGRGIAADFMPMFWMTSARWESRSHRCVPSSPRSSRPIRATRTSSGDNMNRSQA